MNAKEIALNLLIKAKNMASKPLSELSDSLEGTDDRATQAAKSVDKFGNELTGTDKAAGRFIDKSGRMREANGQFVKGLTKTNKTLKDTQQQLNNTSKNAKTLTGRVGGLSKKLKGFLLGGAAVIGLKKLFSGALVSSALFERQMNRVKAASSATTQEMQLLTKAAEEAGSTTEFTATQAAEGLEILVRAGFDAAQAVELLPSVLAVATAEGVGLAEASGLISDTLSVMQLDITKGALATDVLARGSSLANTKMLDLGGAISYTGAFAREAGLDLEQVVAILDVLAKNGLRGERAGTGLRAVLAQLADPASKASKAVAQLGIPTDNFIQLVEQLRQKGPAAATAINAFGIEAGPTLRALIAEGSEGITDFEEQLRGAEGAAKKMADTASDDLIGSAKGFQSAWDSLRKTLSNPLLEPLAGLLDRVAGKFREMKDAGNLQAWGEIISFTLNRVSGALQIIFNTLTFTTKAIGTFIAQITVWVTEAEYQIARLMNKVGLVSDETVRGLEIQAGGVRAVLDALVKEAAQDLEDMGDGWDLLSGKVTLSQQVAAQAAAKASEEAKNTAKTVADAGDSAASALDVATQRIVNSFTQAQAEGKTAAEAIDQAFQEVDLASSEGIQALGTALVEISEQAGGLDTELQDGLTKTLESMTANELEAFRQKAIEAFSGAENGAAKLDRLLSGALEVSLKRLGVDTEKLKSGMSSTGAEAVTAFKNVQDEITRTGTSSKDAAATLRASFEQALGKVNTKEGLDKLEESIDDAADAGIISWGDYQKALEAIEEKYEDLEKAGDDSIFSQKEGLKDLTKEAKKAAKAVSDDADNSEKNAKKKKRLSDANRNLMASYSGVLKIADKTKSEWDSLGDAMTAAWAGIGDGYDRIMSKFHGGTLLYLKTIKEADNYRVKQGKDVVESYERQSAAADRLVETLARGGAQAAALAKNADASLASFDLLDKTRLDSLRSAMTAINNESQQLTDNLSNTVASLQDELAALKGDNASIEVNQYQRQLAELKAAQNTAQTSGNSEALKEAQQAIQLLNEAHRLRLSNIEKEREAAAADASKAATPAASDAANSIGAPARVTKVVQFMAPSGKAVNAEFQDDNAANDFLQLLNDVGAVSR